MTHSYNYLQIYFFFSMSCFYRVAIGGCSFCQGSSLCLRGGDARVDFKEMCTNPYLWVGGVCIA